jgi:CheY-like chemotaxis protein
MTFADALRSVLRQDPDVVVVGEIRDAETAQIAIQVAQTGHVVLATLHTNTAASAITRLIDLGVPPFLVASSVRGVLAQRLVRRTCRTCKGTGLEGTEPCETCRGSKYAGRTGVYSYLHIGTELRDAIRAGESEHELERLGRDYGFNSLARAGSRLVREGATDAREVERALGAEESVHHNETVEPVVSAALVEQAPVPASAKPAGKRKLLIVEDDTNMRCVLEMLFQRAMFDVRTAPHGAAALEMIFTDPPDVVVCDVMMPEMDGIETLKILRRDPATRAIPVLMLTAVDSEENELRLLESGADDFVSKTSDKRILLSRVEHLLARRA